MDCRVCGSTLSIENQPNWLNNSSGKICISCDNNRLRVARRLYKQRPEQRQRAKEWARQYHIDHYHRTWARSTIYNHRKRGYIVSISRQDLEDMAKNVSICPICHNTLDWVAGKKKITWNSPTIDRINNGNVIDKDTIMIICHRCNRAKSNMTLKEFIGYCKTVCSFAESIALSDS